MFNSIIEKATLVHREVFMTVKDRMLGGAHSEVVLPTYERRKHKPKDECEITEMAYYDLVRRKMNAKLSEKTRNPIAALVLVAIIAGGTGVSFFWSTHQPFEKPVKQRVFQNEKVNFLFGLLPGSAREKVEGAAGYFQNRKEAKEAKRAEEQSRKAEKIERDRETIDRFKSDL